MKKNGRPQKTYTDEQRTEIKKAYKKSHSIKERSRLLCIKLRVVKQMPTKQIASITDYSSGYIDAIIREYTLKGLEAVTSKKQVGNHKNMTFEEEVEFLKPYRDKAITGHTNSRKPSEIMSRKKPWCRLFCAKFLCFLNGISIRYLKLMKLLQHMVRS